MSEFESNHTFRHVPYRERVGRLPAADLTHGIYPYPARLYRGIPRHILNDDRRLKDTDYIVDPFCGSGTILLESQRAGYRAFGVDQNPIAVLISSVKTTPVDQEAVQKEIVDAINAAKKRRAFPPPHPMLRRWYSTPTLSRLSRLSAVVLEKELGAERRVLELLIARAARRFAATDKRIPVPVRSRDNPAIDMQWDDVAADGNSVLRQLATLQHMQLPDAEVRLGDARDSRSWGNLPSTPGTVFTSPPYGAAQKYVRSTSLELAWLGHLRGNGPILLERTSIGREHMTVQEQAEELVDMNDWPAALRGVAPSRRRPAAIYARYLRDMRAVFNAVPPQINQAIIVSSKSFVASREVDTPAYIREMATSAGFNLEAEDYDKIAGRSLLTARRGESRPISHEVVQFYKRGE